MVSPQIAMSVGTSPPVTRSNRRTCLRTRSAGAVPRPWAMQADSDRDVIAQVTPSGPTARRGAGQPQQDHGLWWRAEAFGGAPTPGKQRRSRKPLDLCDLDKL